MSDFTILEQTPPNKDPTNSLANTTSVIGATIAHKQLTMDIIIYSLTRKYHDDCEWTGHFMDNFWKIGLPFIPPYIRQQIQQYNIKHGSTTNLPPVDPPVHPPTHQSLCPQQHQQPLSTNLHTTEPTTWISINTTVFTP